MARPFHPSTRRHLKNGFSLILVLGSLVLLSTLVVAFLTGMSSELKSSKLYADGSSVRMLSQSAVNIVLAEIKEATQYTGNKTWASQPGMIRTYDDQGAKKQFYKLYSHAQLVDTGEFNPVSAQNAVPANWSTQKAFYTDLNEPVTITPPGSTTTISAYPIIDGNNLTNMAAVGGNKTYGTGNVPDIDGFSISTSAPATATNSVPMPVSWLYVLANGQVVAPTGTGTTATINGASQTNPIVGRLAFWTDDETCKVNINTAAEGTYWDTPRVKSDADMNLASYQPSQHEYQRYAAHPAMTCLSAVFKTLTPEQIYTIVPRTVGGTYSSLQGTRTGSGILTVRTDRLYSSPDELLFKQSASTDVQRNPNNSSVITKTALEKAKFFITASSRAPDVNLFGKPRVCIWPLYVNDQDTDYTTAFDRLIGFCSKIGGYDYFFRRQNSTNPIIDLPTPPKTTGLGRNRMLLDYLRTLTSQNIPGYTGNFLSKYGPGSKNRDQILIEIFDYIRSTNLLDPTVTKPYTKLMSPSGTVGTGQVVPIYDSASDTRGFGRFPVVQGAFMVFIAQPAASTFSGGQNQVQAAFFVNLFTPAFGYTQTTPYYGLRVEGLSGFKWSGVDLAGSPSTTSNSMGFPIDPAPGQVNVIPSTYGLNGTMDIGGVLDFQKLSSTQAKANGSPLSPASPSSSRVYSSYPPDLGYTLVSSTASGNVIHVTTNSTSTFSFIGGDVTVRIVAPNDASGNAGEIVQSVTLNFPPATCKAPTLVPASTLSTVYTTFHGSSGRLNIKGNLEPFFGPNDTVISVVPAIGDLRMAMPRKSISPADGLFYMAHPMYSQNPVQFAHQIYTERNNPYFGSSYGRLLQLPYWGASLTATTYSAALYTTKINANSAVNTPVVPCTLSSSILGDWDNGISNYPDGPYINKADEGDSNTPPYFASSASTVSPTLFSPNRMLPSAGMFGSLPTGVWSSPPVPWRTLLFCPNPLQGTSHMGFTNPPDYLFLDLFNMPVVEPYAISEPLSTAGRINMNYQIVPFTYINRDTGIRAILKSEKLIAIANTNSGTYKNPSSTMTPNVRLAIDPDETLKGFQSKFSLPDIFRSPAEICSIYLVPAGLGATYSTMENWWNNYRLTGDNSRERPYTTIYPRLTTQSNTYTIHMRVQTLKKAKVSSSTPNQWVEGTDVVTGEYRGSQTIERYVDPNDTSLVDFTASGAPTLDRFYRFRTVTSKQFAP